MTVNKKWKIKKERRLLGNASKKVALVMRVYSCIHICLCAVCMTVCMCTYECIFAHKCCMQEGKHLPHNFLHNTNLCLMHTSLSISTNKSFAHVHYMHASVHITYSHTINDTVTNMQQRSLPHTFIYMQVRLHFLHCA